MVEVARGSDGVGLVIANLGGLSWLQEVSGDFRCFLVGCRYF